MKARAVLELKNDTVGVEGTWDFSNVASICQQGVALINRTDIIEEIKVDLVGLKQSDSSGLAVLTAWVRAARAKNKAIVILNMPSFLQDISRVCGLNSVLPVLWEN